MIKHIERLKGTTVWHAQISRAEKEVETLAGIRGFLKFSFTVDSVDCFLFSEAPASEIRVFKLLSQEEIASDVQRDDTQNRVLLEMEANA